MCVVGRSTGVFLPLLLTIKEKSQPSVYSKQTKCIVQTHGDVQVTGGETNSNMSRSCTHMQAML